MDLDMEKEEDNAGAGEHDDDCEIAHSVALLDITLQQPKVAINLNMLKKSLKPDLQHPLFFVFLDVSFVSTVIPLHPF